MSPPEGPRRNGAPAAHSGQQLGDTAFLRCLALVPCGILPPSSVWHSVPTSQINYPHPSHPSARLCFGQESKPRQTPTAQASFAAFLLLSSSHVQSATSFAPLPYWVSKCQFLLLRSYLEETTLVLPPRMYSLLRSSSNSQGLPISSP